MKNFDVHFEMPRQACFWTRQLELDLVEFIRQRDYIWKPVGNTNHHIQLKYKAYAEFASRLGKGFTARSVRDRWVNIRCTFNHNLRRIEKSRETAKSAADVYVPCWPLWKPLQFLLTNKESYCENESSTFTKEDTQIQKGAETCIDIRLSNQRTNRPRRKENILHLKVKPKNKCKRVLDDLVTAMKPLVSELPSNTETQSYWFLGKHITERLNAMSPQNANSARKDILALLERWPNNELI